MKTLKMIIGGFTVFFLSAGIVVASSSKAQAEECPTYDFNQVFYEDYYPGSVWAIQGNQRVITWTTKASQVFEEQVVRPLTADEELWVIDALQSWDSVLTNISFQQSEQNASADLTIGYTALDSTPNQIGATGYWNAWWGGDSLRYRATIRLKATSSFLSTKEGFIHALQHEVGNVLGLGDIRPTADLESKQEDPWQAPYGTIPLSTFDIGLVRQLYGESTCPSSWAPLLPTPTPIPTPVASKPAAKKVTITCVKGKTIKKVIAIKPKCPTGYRKK